MAIMAVLLVAFYLRWRAFSPFDVSHADELMQYLEQGNRLATGQGILPWEYRYGARNGLVAQLLALPLTIGHWLAPGTLAGMLAARWSFLALTLLTLPAAWQLGALTSRRHALVALFVAAVWFESVLFSELLLSESLATGLMALGAALLLAETPAYRRAGVLLGLGVIVRLQYAPFAVVLALAVLGRDWRGWARLAQGAILALALGAISDIAMGRVPFGWIAVNLSYNIHAGRAASFGASGPFQYVLWLFAHLGPASPFILAGALLSPRRYRPLVWALIANLLVHSLIAHKEYRFVWLSTFLVLVLAAIASLEVFDRLLAKRDPRLALAAACGLWLVLSWRTEALTGGARSMRGGAPIPLAALDAAKRDEICGIAIPDQFRAHLVPALLPRAIPLYVAPAGALVERGDEDRPGQALPAGLMASANALVFPVSPAGAQGYREVSCRSNGAIRACLYVRPGGCVSDKTWSYQAALEREDL